MCGIRTLIIFVSMLAISKAIDPNNVCCLLKDGSKIVDDTDCGSFYTCKQGKATKGSCPTGYNFNKNAQSCQTAAQFSCGSVEGNPCEGITTSKFVKNPTTCNGYYYCVNGAISRTDTCPGDLFFDEDAQTCDYKENVGCSAITDTNPKVVCAYVEDNQYFGSASSCSGWTKCSNGVPKNGVCDPQFIFNVQKRECDYKANYNCPQLNGDAGETGEVEIKCKATEEGNILQNGNSCSSWLKCDGTKYVKFACKPGFFYQPATKTCEKRLDAVTFEDCNRCEGTTLDFVNTVDDNCKGYLRCKNGKQQGNGSNCKEGFYFDEAFGSCTNKNPKHRVCFEKCDTCTSPCETDCKGKDDCDCICTVCDDESESGEAGPPTTLTKCEPAECDANVATPVNICNTPDCGDDCECTCEEAECIE